MNLKNYLFIFALANFGLCVQSQAQTGNAFGGDNSGANNTGNFNTGFGVNSLMSNTSHSNSAFGFRTLMNNQGGYNCAFGNDALMANTTGSLNCALGTRVLQGNTTGESNVAIGHRSMEANTTGSRNTGLGYGTLLKNIGSDNIAIGYNTPRSLNFGNSNIFIGTETAQNLKNGNANVILGKVIFANAPTTDLIAGNDVNNTVILADGVGNQKLFISKAGNVGIGLGNNVIPKNKLDVAGGVAIGRNFVPNTQSDMPSLAPKNGLIVEGYVGIGNSLPGNKLEITQGTAGKSGLRFTNLTSNNISNITQTAAAFLTVDTNGDVILRKQLSFPSSVVNTISGNQLTTSVNGINSNTVTLPTQVLTQSGNTITLSNNGGSFVLPTFTDTDAQSLALSGNVLSISNGNSVTLPSFAEVDGSTTNELQTLTQTGNTITLSQNGGTITLPTFTDTDAQSLALSGNVLSISNGNSVTLPSFTDTDDQTLTLNGNTLSIANGNTITLPSTSVVAGTNVTVSGNGSTATPYQISANDTSLYANNGVINQSTTVSNNRIVDMNDRNIWFNTSTSTNNGKIYIGSSTSYPTTTGNYKLFVEGGILTEKVKVALRNTANWADYVFADNYKLMPLKEVESFVKTNKHLPGVSSASEIVENGLDVAEMQSKHMEKIEELTLYIIEQDKKLDVQQQAIEKQNSEIEILKAQLKVLIEKNK
ncbi:hypothetical protein GCM10011508_14870 [Flavobacterium lutivivi]|nr:hypothetical protein GCM10011508_14870 [Flavobacterium lutivivi]